MLDHSICCTICLSFSKAIFQLEGSLCNTDEFPRPLTIVAFSHINEIKLLCITYKHKTQSIYLFPIRTLLLLFVLYIVQTITTGLKKINLDKYPPNLVNCMQNQIAYSKHNRNPNYGFNQHSSLCILQHQIASKQDKHLTNYQFNTDYASISTKNLP